MFRVVVLMSECFDVDSDGYYRYFTESQHNWDEDAVGYVERTCPSKNPNFMVERQQLMDLCQKYKLVVDSRSPGALHSKWSTVRGGKVVRDVLYDVYAESAPGARGRYRIRECLVTGRCFLQPVTMSELLESRLGI